MMTTLKNLTAEPSAEPYVEKRGHVVTVHAEVTPGCFLTVGLGPAGLQIHRGETGVAIPLLELIEMAGRVSPEVAALIAPAKADATSDNAGPDNAA